MANILYIHGFGSNHNSGTFIELKKVFPEHKFFSDDFDLLDVQGTLNKIKELCTKNDINLIIGKSLGGFYTLAYEGPENKMVINPCVKPWIEIPKLNPSPAVPENILEKWQQLFEETEKRIDGQERSKTVGIFGDKDELFSYKDYFDEKYQAANAGMQKSFMIPGKHHIDIKELKAPVAKGIDYFATAEGYK